MDETLSRHITEMKNMANILMPYSFPITTFSEELIISPLKQRVIVVDGYDIMATYSKLGFPSHYSDNLQIQSMHSPFLPFNLVCKLGKSFLGEENLSYLEIFREGKKWYCWTTKTVDGKTIPPNEDSEFTTYEGFKYSILNYK